MIYAVEGRTSDAAEISGTCEDYLLGWIGGYHMGSYKSRLYLSVF